MVATVAEAVDGGGEQRVLLGAERVEYHVGMHAAVDEAVGKQENERQGRCRHGERRDARGASGSERG